jgi:DNA polymerase elongation subunit (family B)
MAEYKIPLDEIEKFLNGHDDEKYIVNIEYDRDTNLIHKIKQDPEKGLYIEKEPLLAFMWIKNLNKVKEIVNFYGNSHAKIKSAREKFGIEIKSLENGNHPKLIDGYKYLVTCNQGHQRMLQFFKDGGIYIYDKRSDINNHFLMVSPVEQYLIHTGKRLFKGFDEYSEIHKMVFDLETTGLDPKVSRIFMIGIYTNQGIEEIIPIEDDDESERQGIIKFFDKINDIKPAIIAGYNSANFDWPFFFKRCEILGLDIQKIAITLKVGELINNKSGMLKLGNEVENYEQTNMFGYSIIDIMHSARRAQAIDSSMKSVGLKYVCKYNKINKSNRVYIDGDKIGNTWYSEEKFYFNNRTGGFTKTKPSIEFIDNITREYVKSNPNDIFVYSDNVLMSGYGEQSKEMRGETNAIGIITKKKSETTDDSFFNDLELDDNKVIINQGIKNIIHHINKGKRIIFPKSGIGNDSSQLQIRAPKTYAFLIQTLKALRAYIDTIEEVDGKYIVERYLIDDLWETMEVDEVYNQSSFLLAKLVPTTYQRVSTMGTAGLWKLLMMAYSFENNLAIPVPEGRRDFTGGLSRLFKVGYSEELRKMDYNSLYPAIQLAHDIFPTADINGAMKSMLKYFHTERFNAKNLASKYKKDGNYQLADKYKRKQLPLKIFINSMFGALGAPMAFQWAEIDVSEQITCTARQYLRLLVNFFIKKGYEPSVLDTDGVNFTAPEDGEPFTYVGKGLNDEVTAGKIYTGVEAVVAEFNDLYMRNEMGLGLDGVWPSTINLSRKNYALLEYDGNISLTGNSIKSKKLPLYIEEFLNKGIKMLLEGKGYDFVKYYHEYAEKIYNKEIPLAKIATKSRVKKGISDYKNRGVDKNGRQLPKQAHMELAVLNNLNINLGDTIYYVNNGKTKSHGDAQEDKNGNMYASLVPMDIIENQPDYIGEYNVPKYLDAFNKKIRPLLVSYPIDIRDGILITKPEDKKMYLKSELNLVNNQPNDIGDQDTLIEFYTPSPMEKEFWAKMSYNPDYWFDDNIVFKIPGFNEEIPV